MLTAQVKFSGDGYPGGYANGLSMLGSETMDRFKVISDSEFETILQNDDGITLSCRHFPAPEAPSVTSCQTIITNNSDHFVTLEMLTSFCLTEVKADRVYRMTSFWSAEGRLKIDSLNDLNLEKSWAGHGTRVEKFGCIGSMPVRGYFPFVAVEDSTSGHFTAAKLYTPSSWQIELFVRRSEELTLAGGIADADYGHWTKTLAPGQTYEAPKALITEGSSLEEVCSLLLKAETPDISPIDNSMGITFNEYCTTWGNPTIDNMKRICDKLRGKGIQYLVMDSGWYLKPGQYWWDYIGSWSVDSTRFPNGLRELSDYVRTCGMIPGIWFEPECVAWGSALYNKTEYLLTKGGIPITVGGRRFLDMENPDVRDFLRESVIRLLKENNFGYIKIDYNDTIGVGCDGPEGYGENLRRKLLATQKFFKELRHELPDLVIENCSSGGHRLEPSMMELCSMASFSDAHEPLCVPIIAANLMRLVRSEQNQIWAVLRKTDSDARIFYSLCATFMGRIGLSGDIYELSDHQWTLVNQGLEFYRQASDIIKSGTVTAIETNVESYNDPVGYQITVRRYENRLLIIEHRFKGDDYILPVKYLEGRAIISEYGSLDSELSAKAWIVA